MYMYVRIVCVCIHTHVFPSIALSLSLFRYISTPQCRHTLAALLEVLAGHKLPKSEKTGDTPSAPRKRSAEEFHVEAKRRRQEPQNGFEVFLRCLKWFSSIISEQEMTCETTLWIVPAASGIFRVFLYQDSVEISFKEYAMQASFQPIFGWGGANFKHARRICRLGGFACNKRYMENQLANQLQSKLAQIGFVTTSRRGLSTTWPQRCGIEESHCPGSNPYCSWQWMS